MVRSCVPYGFRKGFRVSGVGCFEGLGSGIKDGEDLTDLLGVQECLNQALMHEHDAQPDRNDQA